MLLPFETFFDLRHARRRTTPLHGRQHLGRDVGDLAQPALLIGLLRLGRLDRLLALVGRRRGRHAMAARLPARSGPDGWPVTAASLVAARSPAGLAGRGQGAHWPVAVRRNIARRNGRSRRFAGRRRSGRRTNRRRGRPGGRLLDRPGNLRSGGARRGRRFIRPGCRRGLLRCLGGRGQVGLLCRRRGLRAARRAGVFSTGIACFSWGGTAGGAAGGTRDGPTGAGVLAWVRGG